MRASLITSSDYASLTPSKASVAVSYLSSNAYQVIPSPRLACYGMNTVMLGSGRYTALPDMAGYGAIITSLVLSLLLLISS